MEEGRISFLSDYVRASSMQNSGAVTTTLVVRAADIELKPAEAWALVQLARVAGAETLTVDFEGMLDAARHHELATALEQLKDHAPVFSGVLLTCRTRPSFWRRQKEWAKRVHPDDVAVGIFLILLLGAAGTIVWHTLWCVLLSVVIATVPGAFLVYIVWDDLFPSLNAPPPTLILNAAEVRRITERAALTPCVALDRTILEAARAGRSSVSFEIPVPAPMITALRAAGFTVPAQPGAEAKTISWAK